MLYKRTFPKFIYLSGSKNCGKKTLSNYILKRYPYSRCKSSILYSNFDSVDEILNAFIYKDIFYNIIHDNNSEIILYNVSSKEYLFKSFDKAFLELISSNDN